MKLRILGNSLRFRLTQSEVSTLVSEGSVEEETSLGEGQKLSYGLETRQGGGSPSVHFDPKAQRPRLTVSLPYGTVATWAAGAEAGIYSEKQTETGPLAIRVEKDFRCLTPRDESQDPPDAYPHPRVAEEEC